MFAMIFAIVAAALQSISGFASSMQQGNAQKQKADMLTAQAQATRRNAGSEAARARAEAYQIDRQKSRYRSEYDNIMGKNRVSLAAGNVDMSSGSALAVAEGNANNYAIDMADNEYARAMTLWSGEEARRMGAWQADVQEANASYLKQTAAGLDTSILTALLGGGGTFASSYGMAGGDFSRLFGGSGSGAQGLAAISGGKAGFGNLQGPGLNNLAAGIVK
ncbi:MAG: hypothetical protein NC489_43690 [Ruminococcus flavefaciens]|nr:hypothetical protein [Ruminococcus flavefaciens]